MAFRSLAIGELARRMKQVGDTCVIASGLFSAAYRHHAGQPIHPQIRDAVNRVILDSRHYLALQSALSPKGQVTIADFVNTQQAMDILPWFI